MNIPTLPLSATQWHSPLGDLLLVAHPHALCGCWFSDQKGIPTWAIQAPHAPHPLLETAIAQLEGYFAGTHQHFTLPLDWGHGTPFQQDVWQALLSVPYASTQTYGQLAQCLQRPQAARAIGAAVGRNPLGIIVPCHRIVGADGSLTGYTGGLARKRFLLELESSGHRTPNIQVLN